MIYVLNCEQVKVVLEIRKNKKGVKDIRNIIYISIFRVLTPTVREPSPGMRSIRTLIPPVTIPSLPRAYPRVWRTVCPTLARAHSFSSNKIRYNLENK